VAAPVAVWRSRTEQVGVVQLAEGVITSVYQTQPGRMRTEPLDALVSQRGRLRRLRAEYEPLGNCWISAPRARVPVAEMTAHQPRQDGFLSLTALRNRHRRDAKIPFSCPAIPCCDTRTESEMLA